MTGFTREDVIGQFPAILKTDSVTDDIATDLIQATKGGEVWRGELKTLRSNGETFWAEVTVSSLRDEYDRSHYIGIIEDSTEKRRAAIDLERSKQSYEDVFNSSSDAIYLLNDEGVFIAVNRGATKMYQQEREWLIGKSPADVSAEGHNDLEKVKQFLQRAMEGEHVRFEFWGKRKNGEIFPKEVHVNQVSYFGEKVLMATARDITDQKRIEAELKEAAARAEESEKVKGFFLANMSHEIRTPLTSIVGYIDLIFGRIKDHLSDRDAEYFDIIRRNSDRLTRAVHSIIDLSQIEAGVTKVEKGPVNIGQVMEIVCNDHRVAAAGKNLDFTYHKSDQNFWINGDKELLQTAFSNLVDNAISYTEQGQVDIYLKARPNHTAQLVIKDTGIGISENSLSSIFESFNQESMGYTKDYQGLGLGLTLAKKNLELHNLKIEVESEKGHGSSFSITFPELLSDEETQLFGASHAQEQKAESTAPSAEQAVVAADPAPNVAGLTRILIVEDDENAQRLFGLFLRNNYHIDYATTVAEARSVLKQNATELVLTDLSLVGGESGLDLVEWIREQPDFDKLPVIALTAHAFVSDRQKCMDAGCDDFITKPIFRAQLLDILGKNLHG
jgi:PAS domain S-box-containing protein